MERPQVSLNILYSSLTSSSYISGIRIITMFFCASYFSCSSMFSINFKLSLLFFASGFARLSSAADFSNVLLCLDKYVATIRSFKKSFHSSAVLPSYNLLRSNWFLNKLSFMSSKYSPASSMNLPFFASSKWVASLSAFVNGSSSFLLNSSLMYSSLAKNVMVRDIMMKL